MDVTEYVDRDPAIRGALFLFPLIYINKKKKNKKKKRLVMKILFCSQITF